MVPLTTLASTHNSTVPSLNDQFSSTSTISTMAEVYESPTAPSYHHPLASNAVLSRLMRNVNKHDMAKASTISTVAVVDKSPTTPSYHHPEALNAVLPGLMTNVEDS
jgi:hypothetical protein